MSAWHEREIGGLHSLHDEKTRVRIVAHEFGVSVEFVRNAFYQTLHVDRDGLQQLRRLLARAARVHRRLAVLDESLTESLP